MDYIKELRALVGHRPLLLCGSGAYIVKNGMVLLQRRLDNGLWACHGGIMEPGETTEETMRREVYEETGLTVTEYELLCVTSGRDVHCIYPNGDECYFVDIVYLVRNFTGQLHAQECEVAELAWFPLEKLPAEEEFTPSDLPSYRKLREKFNV